MMPHADWLRGIGEETVRPEPPKVYAWTARNLKPAGQPFSSKSQVEERVQTPDDEKRRIYIVGVGNIGRLYAICLAKLANRPPITLVVNRKSLLEQWVAQPGIELTRHGEVHRSADFDIEWWTEARPDHGPVSELRGIGNMIVTTKAADAVPTVDHIRRYLSRDSVVAFAHNGMCKLWPPLGTAYVGTRFRAGESPSWIACVTTHGVTSLAPFRSLHASPANALVGPVIPGDSVHHGQMDYLMQQISDAPDLNARKISRKDLWVAQLEKLVVNSIINPLTAVLRVRNGELFSHRNDDLPLVIDKLLEEASETLTCLIRDPNSDSILLSGSADGADSQLLSQLQQELSDRFSFARLREMVLGVGDKVAANTSSMLQDIRADKTTEIDDFNGWLVDTARSLDKGLRLPTHEGLIALVKARAELSRRELCRHILG